MVLESQCMKDYVDRGPSEKKKKLGNWNIFFWILFIYILTQLLPVGIDVKNVQAELTMGDYSKGVDFYEK